MKAAALLALLTLLAFTAPVSAGDQAFADLALEPHPGAGLPLATALHDEAGGAVSLGNFFTGKPVVLVLDYLRCRTICGVVLGSLAAATAAVPPNSAHDYTVLAISIDPRDTPVDAAAAKTKYLARYPAPVASAWHFLTGSESAVRAIGDIAGFHYRYDPTSDQYIHSAAIVIAAPEGSVASYVADLDVTPATLAAALDAAQIRRTAGSLQRLLLLCFGGSTSGRYTALIEAAVVLFNIAGMLAACGLFLWLRHHQHR
jgi:protein SCO1/2